MDGYVHKTNGSCTMKIILGVQVDFLTDVTRMLFCKFMNDSER